MADKDTFIAVMRTGLYLEHGAPVGTMPRGPRWQVCDLQGNLHASGDNVETVLDTAWRRFERRLAWEQQQSDG